MGIFTSNTISSIGGTDYSTLPALEGYDSVTGCAVAMLEVQQNDMALFNAAIMEDFKEVSAVNEGVEILNESAMDILKKIKEVFMKLLQKIKGIFQAFLAKLSKTFGSQNAIYERYKNKISQCNTWKDFKVKKYREVKNNGSGIASISNINYITTGMSYTISAKSAFGMDLTEDSLDTDTINKNILERRLKDLDVDDDLKNMNAALMDSIFEDEDTKENWSVADIISGNIGSVLAKGTGNKIKEAIEKSNKNLNDAISKIITELDKESVKIRTAVGNQNLPEKEKDAEYSNRIIGTTGDKYKVTNNDIGIKISGEQLKTLSKTIGNLQKVATQEQQIITAFTSAKLSAIKFLISQARRVWSSAAAYASVKHEGYEYYTAVGEASEYDFMSDMDAICD